MTDPLRDGPHWHLDTDGEGVAWLSLNRVGSSTNTLSGAVVAELGARLKSLPAGLKGLVITSAKRGNFIAGADIHEFPKLTTAAQATALELLEQLAGGDEDHEGHDH